ncbi:MAG: PPIC-type PPIASE domain protein [Candidatus Magasanikbacteria bacterium GW2011_GWC2_40_17]|uniref:peptidylprolyl isomerase n=1 Tax=Candidatus Magasanikbacteria bacterium GW2011_GWA2_42_32 TaxID=1619039 RepID=A0A0G1A8Y9_9BACT|nr:MAG: PPIC-type PPIASE domain protein [Candidatus Magasanikbacteria bacterium GW2011_GWC2_40_17]KKS57490.1 MAG: PPIC-type PPIASE domain protein [Candidatus Magasanikbacteria bacterium GW2011_GWA2_42_32]OGH85206.1 MAG: hypothetical protein A2294_00460 [Candidatus Magasanikbacteria bacterium RIFOXYB2_FULL_38_10]
MENQIDSLEEKKTEQEKNKRPVYQYALWGLGAAAFLAIILIVSFVCYRAEKNLSTDSFTLGVARYIGLPAGFVDGTRVSYVEYIDNLRAVKQYYSTLDAAQAKPTDEQLNQYVWDMLAHNAVIKKMAAENNIVVTGEEIDKEYQNFIQNFSSETEAGKYVSDQYGWTVDKFKLQMLRPYLLAQKISVSESVGQKMEEKAKPKAEEVLKQIKEGKKSFADLAKEFGEDATKDKGGDLGWFGTGVMIKEFEDVVSKMSPGEISDLVKTQFGYHIIKLEEKRLNDKKETEWHASHILIKAGFQDYLEELFKNAKIRKWIKI